MNHMMKRAMNFATVRDLRYQFPKIEARLRQGEEVEIRKRQRVVGRLPPPRSKHSSYPDSVARTRRIFGDRVLAVTGAELVSRGRAE